MATLKRLLAYMLGGAIAGAVAASLLGLWFVPWYNSPGDMVPAAFNPAPFAKHVAESILQGQLVGAAVGAVILLALGITLQRSRAKAQAAQAALAAKPVEPAREAPPRPM